jgi:hypothetical protein
VILVIGRNNTWIIRRLSSIFGVITIVGVFRFLPLGYPLVALLLSTSLLTQGSKDFLNYSRGGVYLASKYLSKISLYLKTKPPH